MTFLLLWSIRAATTILLGLLLTLVLRRRSAAVRSVALRVTLLAAWALPFVALVAPRLEVTLPQTTAATASLVVPEPMTGRAEESGDPSPAPITTSSPAVPEASTHGSGAPLSAGLPGSSFPSASLLWAEAAYVAVALGLSLRWLRAVVRLRRIVRLADPIEPDVALTSEMSVPVTFGLLRPRILLPESSKAWPPARVRAAILHERAHVRRRDWAWQTLAALFAAVHWANPLAWLLVRALRDVAEAAADDEVLAQMGPSEYARELLAVAETARPVGPGLAMARRGGVRDRVVAILAANRDRRRPTLATGGLLLLIVLAASLAVAGIRRGTRQKWTKTLASGVKVAIESLHDVKEGESVHRAWTPEGSPLPGDASKDAQANIHPPRVGERKVAMRFQLSGLSGLEPSIRLLEPVVSPSAVLTLGTPQTQIAWNVPQTQVAQKVKLGIASGPWLAYKGPDVPFRARSVRVNGHLSKPLSTAVAFPYPSALKGKNVRIRLLDARGNTLALDGEGYVVPTSYAVSNVHWFNRVNPSPVRRLEFEYRDYETAEFPNVAVRPRPTLEGQGLSGSIALESIAGPGTDGKLARWTPTGKPLALGRTNFQLMGDERPGLRTNLLSFRYSGAGPTPTFNLQARSPSVSMGSIVDPKTKTIQAYVATPKAIADTDVHLDFADGPWERYQGPPLVKGPAPAMSPYLKQVGNGLSVRIPQELRSQATDLRVYVKGHREPFTGFMNNPAGDLKTVAFRGRSEDVERIELWRRPYRRIEFKNVRLLPPNAKEARSPFGPFRLADRRAVQLYALIEDDGPVHRVWGPEGSHGWDAWDGSAPPSTPKRRSLSLWFRVWGAPLVQPEVDASVIGGSPWESGRYRGTTEGATAIERTLDTHLWVERGRTLANLQVDLRLGPWRTEADLPVGKGKAELDPYTDQLGGQPFRYCRVTLPGAPARQAPDRLVELVPYDREGRRIPTMSGSRPGPQEGRYFVAVERPESVARLVLRTRAHQTIRLKNVRLAPR